jgi:hypothetical protein
LAGILDYRVSTGFARNYNTRKISGSDFAVVKLQTSLKRQQYCKISNISEKYLKGAEITIAGYPW